MDVNHDLLTQPFPREAIRQRKGGGNKMLEYVEGHTVIHRLNAATGNSWSFRVLDLTTRTITTDRGQSTLLTAKVELEIPGLGARQHIGVQMVNDAGGEDLAKGAITDALKKAATLFGVGLELYGPDYEAGELPTTRQHAPQARTRPDTRRYPVQDHTATQDAPAASEGVTDNPYGHASEKQAKFIGHLLKELEWTREDATRYLDATYGVKRISELGSRQDVSTFIEHLQAVKAQNQPEEVGV